MKRKVYSSNIFKTFSNVKFLVPSDWISKENKRNVCLCLCIYTCVCVCTCVHMNYFFCFTSQKRYGSNLLVSFIIFIKILGFHFPLEYFENSVSIRVSFNVNNKLKEVNYLNLFLLRWVRTRGMQSWMGRVSTNCPQRISLLLYCSAILGMWLHPPAHKMAAEPPGTTSYIPGSKTERVERPSNMPSKSFPFYLRKVSPKKMLIITY